MVETWNSCCLNCYVNADSTFTDLIPESVVFRIVKTTEVRGDKNCAGCTDYYFRVLEFITSGTDTLRYIKIPMGTAREYDCSKMKKELLEGHYQPETFVIVVGTR